MEAAGRSKQRRAQRGVKGGERKLEEQISGDVTANSLSAALEAGNFHLVSEQQQG